MAPLISRVHSFSEIIMKTVLKRQNTSINDIYSSSNIIKRTLLVIATKAVINVKSYYFLFSVWVLTVYYTYYTLYTIHNVHFTDQLYVSGVTQARNRSHAPSARKAFLTPLT